MKRLVAKPQKSKSQVRLILCGLLATFGIAMPPAESYADKKPLVETAAAGITQQISMGVGKSIVVDLPRDAAEIFIGNPKVANAVVRSAHKLYIIGTAEGQTT